MNTIEELRRQAKAHRDETIQLARQAYRQTMADLDRIAVRMDKPIRKHWSPLAEGLSSTAHAEAILRERGPLTVLEIAVEAQARGYRPGEPARRITHVLRGVLRYHRTRFVRIGEKWALA